MQNLSNLVVYNDGEFELKILVDSEIVWLNKNQLSEFFGKIMKISIYSHISLKLLPFKQKNQPIRLEN